MSRVLSTYSIESEQNVVLSFLDGTSLRCRFDELPRYLQGHELERVSNALLLRRSFIKRVLPPTAVIAMLAATVALGTYDYNKYRELTLKAPNPPALSEAAAPSAAVGQVQVTPSTPQLIEASASEEPASKPIVPQSVVMTHQPPAVPQPADNPVSLEKSSPAVQLVLQRLLEFDTVRDQALSEDSRSKEAGSDKKFKK